jgi:hypothetical protein
MSQLASEASTATLEGKLREILRVGGDDHGQLLGLLGSLLTYSPSERISAAEAAGKYLCQKTQD